MRQVHVVAWPARKQLMECLVGRRPQSIVGFEIGMDQERDGLKA